MSIRARMVATSAVLSTVMLCAFAVAAWLLMSRQSIERIDGFLGDQLRRQLDLAPLDRDWSLIDSRLNDTEVSGTSGAVLLRVVGQSDEVVYESDGWADELLLEPPPSGLRGAEGIPPEPPALGKGEGTRWSPGVRPRQGQGPGPGFQRRGRPPPSAFATRMLDGRTWRVASAPSLGGSVHSLTIATDVGHFAPELKALQRVFLLILPLGLLLIAVSSWLVAGRALAPARRLADELDGITARGLHARLEWPTRDAEFQRLSNSLNGMLERLERSFGQATRFSADAAHELKTPLTVLQGELGEALQEPSATAEQQALYSGLLEEVQRLKSIVEKLLLLSRADAGALRLTRAPFDISSAAEALADDMAIMGPELRVDSHIERGIIIPADADLLPHILGNLATNAVKYTPSGGSIKVGLTHGPGGARLVVANTCQPIAASERSRIFDRFFRLDPARTRKGEGSGLGLSLAREIARAHGGELALADTSDDQVEMVLELPFETVGFSPL